MDGNRTESFWLSRAVPSESQYTSLVSTASLWSVWTGIFAVFIGVLLIDQFQYIRKKGPIAGPTFKIPLIGPFLESMNPKFENYMTKWNSGPLSCVSVFHKFVVIASTRDLARRVFNSSSFVKPCVVDVAHKILRPNNWVFLDGKAHVEYRKGLNHLFTRKAIGVYLPGQELVYKQYFAKFVQASKNGFVPFMPHFRDISTAVSCRTFCGQYITDEEVSEISKNYYKVTQALELVNFPIILPFTKAWYGRRCADMTMGIFARCAAKSRVRMQNGGDVTCTMDAWIKSMIESKYWDENSQENEPSDVNRTFKSQIRNFSDEEISMTIFTFLFASQDATSSASTWLFQILADRPEILEKVREEQLRVRNGDPDLPLNIDMIDKMEYTRRVVKECLRLRPPVIMVPYLAKKDYPVTPEYTVPKGAMVIPTLYPALHDPEVYPEPETFDPDRWGENGTAEQAKKNWLVFGTGPHVCLGQNYVIMHLMSMIGMASLHLKWDHRITEQSENIKVFATIFPEDDCMLRFDWRGSGATFSS